LINASPKGNPLLYLTQFKEAMETLQKKVASELVDIIYEKPDLPMESYSSITSSPLKFEGGYDNYYLRDIDFTKIRFTDGFPVNFAETNMSGVDLTKSILKGLELQSANLEGANLTETDFSGANLNGANLRGTNLTNTDLRGASLVGAQLGGAYWEEGHPPLIDNKTRFIYDNILNPVGQDVFPLKKLKELLRSENRSYYQESIEKIQKAFEGVSLERKEFILESCVTAD
jgi:hypothetical protein